MTPRIVYYVLTIYVRETRVCACSRLNNDPKDIRSQSLEYINITLFGKIVYVGMIKEIVLDYLVGPKCHHKHPYRDMKREILLTRRRRRSEKKRQESIKRFEDAGLEDLS